MESKKIVKGESLDPSFKEVKADSVKVSVFGETNLDNMTDAELEKYHHHVQTLGDQVYTEKLRIKAERDARAAEAALSPAALKALKGKHQRMSVVGEKLASVQGAVGG